MIAKMNFQSTSAAPDSDADRLLCLALDVAEGLLKNGDSVRHVEETIRRICFAYGAAHVENFAITSVILASVRMQDGSYSSQMRRLDASTNLFCRLEDYNRFSRKICSSTPSFDEAQQMLRDLKQQYSYPRWLLWLGGSMTAGFFAILFGGSWRDGLAGALVGLFLAWFSSFRFRNINVLAKTVMLSFSAGVLSYLTVLIGLGQNLDMIMIGSIMLLIPGLAFGNALRDLLCGDILTGILKTVQSCLTAILIACGFSAAILLLNGTGVESNLPPEIHALWQELIVVVFGTVGFSAMFAIRPRYFPIVGIGGGLVYLVYVFAIRFGCTTLLAAFFCAAFGALLSELFARMLRAPAIVFLTPCIIAIVPGGGLYYTMSALIAENRTQLASKFSETLSISAGLAVGTLLVAILVSLCGKKKTV